MQRSCRAQKKNPAAKVATGPCLKAVTRDYSRWPKSCRSIMNMLMKFR